MPEASGAREAGLPWTIDWTTFSAEACGASGSMRISVSEAKGRLTDLVRRAEAGEDVILTRHGEDAVRFVALRARPDAAGRRALIAAVRASAAGKAGSRPDAARSQDFLYGDDGLPR